MGIIDSNTIDHLFWRIALKDDEKAFQTLFCEFFPSLCVFAHRYVDNWEICEDIVQDTFFKIWKNRKEIEISISARGFLLTSVRNSCVDYLRRKDVENDWRLKEMERNLGYSSDDLYSIIELEQILNTALAKLPEKIRVAFEMNRFEGETYANIATKQGISIKTVESYMSKALKYLRIELKDYLSFIVLFL